MSWQHYTNQPIPDGLFVNEYTMTYDAHHELVEILHPYLRCQEYNSHSTEWIAVEHIVAVGLHHLQGHQVKDAMH